MSRAATGLMPILAVFLILIAAGPAQAADWVYHDSGMHTQSDVWVDNGVEGDDPPVDVDTSTTEANSSVVAEVWDPMVHAECSGGGSVEQYEIGQMSVHVWGSSYAESETAQGTGSGYGNANTVAPAYTDGIYFELVPTAGEAPGDWVTVHLEWQCDLLTTGWGQAAVTGGYGDYDEHICVTLNSITLPYAEANVVWEMASVHVENGGEHFDGVQGQFNAQIGDIIGINIGADTFIDVAGEGYGEHADAHSMIYLFVESEPPPPPVEADFAAVLTATNPDILVAFNTGSPEEMDQGNPIATLAGNFIRGLELESEDQGWYVTTSSYAGGPVGIFRLSGGVSTQVGDLGFETLSLGGMSFSVGEDFLWLAIDPDFVVPETNGPLPFTLFRIDFDGSISEVTQLAVAGADHLMISGLAVDPNSGVLYAIDNDLDALLTINTTTGEGTVVGSGLGFDFSGWTAGLDFTTDGSALIMVSNSGGDVRVVDTTTGLAGPSQGSLGTNTSAIAAAPPASSTVSAALTCLPESGILPFDTVLNITLNNDYQNQWRRLAARLDVVLANGSTYSNVRAGYTNVAPGSSYFTMLTLTLDDSQMEGLNVFDLVLEDVTPAPYNQPPYAAAGDTAVDSCTVEGQYAN